MNHDNHKQVTQALVLAEAFGRVLAGTGPEVQGAALADLLATYLLGHPSDLREKQLELMVATVRDLVALARKEGKDPHG